MKNRFENTWKDMFTAPMRMASLAGLMLAMTMSTWAQDRIIRVDIANGSASGIDGSDWGSDAFKFLQDALTEAADHQSQPGQDNHVIEIWVAEGTYRPDQKWGDMGGGLMGCLTCGDREQSFQLRDNVAIYGGFHPSGLLARDPVAYPTILSGDLNSDNGNPKPLVAAHRVNATAVMDGFVLRGGIELRGAQPYFRDCVMALHEGAAVRCDDASHAVFQRCVFSAMDCDSIVVEGGSRVELLLCEPAAMLHDAHTCGRARVADCSTLLAVDQAKFEAMTQR